MCYVSTVATPIPGYSPDTPSLPDATMIDSPALPDPAQCPPSIKHPEKERPPSKQEPVFNGSTAAGYYSKEFPSDSYASDTALLGCDTRYHCYANDKQMEVTYDNTESPSLSCYSHPASSPVVGLNDSLEDMECSEVTSSKEYNATHSRSHQSSMLSEQPWLPPPAEDHHFSTSERDFFSTSSSFSRARPEREWRGVEQTQHHLARSSTDNKLYDLPIYNPSTSAVHKTRGNFAHNPQPTASFSFNPSFASGPSEECSNSASITTQPALVSQNWGIGLGNSNSMPEEAGTSNGISGLHQFDPDWNSSRDGVIASHPNSSHNWTTKNPLRAPPSEPTTTSYQHDVTSGSTSMFNVGHLVPRSTKAIASSVVRKPRQTIPPVEQKPVKALDLGLEGGRERNVKLRSNDRVLPTHSSLLEENIWMGRSREAGKTSNSVAEGEIVRSKYFPASAGSSIPSKSSSSRVISSSRVSIGGGATESAKLSGKGVSGYDWGDASSANSSSKGASGFDWGGALSTYLSEKFNNRASGPGFAALGPGLGHASATNLTRMSSKVADLKAFHQQEGSLPSTQVLPGIFQRHNMHSASIHVDSISLLRLEYFLMFADPPDPP